MEGRTSVSQGRSVRMLAEKRKHLLAWDGETSRGSTVPRRQVLAVCRLSLDVPSAARLHEHRRSGHAARSNATSSRPANERERRRWSGQDTAAQRQHEETSRRCRDDRLNPPGTTPGNSPSYGASWSAFSPWVPSVPRGQRRQWGLSRVSRPGDASGRPADAGEGGDGPHRPADELRKAIEARLGVLVYGRSWTVPDVQPAHNWQLPRARSPDRQSADRRFHQSAERPFPAFHRFEQ